MQAAVHRITCFVIVFVLMPNQCKSQTRAVPCGLFQGVLLLPPPSSSLSRTEMNATNSLLNLSFFLCVCVCNAHILFQHRIGHELGALASLCSLLLAALPGLCAWS